MSGVLLDGAQHYGSIVSPYQPLVPSRASRW